MILPEISKRLIILLAVIWCGSIANSAFAQATLKAAGSVTDESGGPLARAQVRLYSTDRILQTSSDTAGHFQFDRVPFGSYQLEVAASSYKTITNDDVRVTAATRSEDLQFKFVLLIGDLNAECLRHDRVSYELSKPEDGNSINGKVIAAPRNEKSPVANARVSLLTELGVKLGEQVTNERGEFQFKAAAPGRYIIEVTHASYHPLRSTVFLTARENRTWLTLDPVRIGWMIACQ